MAVDNPQELPACHIFSVGDDCYAYDLNTQQLVRVEKELAAALREPGCGSGAARAALRRARKDDGLFLSHRPRLVPRPERTAAEVEHDLDQLVLTVTEACNLRCAYCLHGASLAWVRDHGIRRMPVAMAVAATKYFLDHCAEATPPTISFYGGEPLLQPELLLAVIKAVRSHPRGTDTVFAIDTNGVELSEEALDLILAERLYLQISLDGPPVYHDRYRRDTRGRPTALRILHNIDRLLARSTEAAERLSFVATLAPPVDLPTVAAYFADFPPFVARGVALKPMVTVNFANLSGQNWPSGQEEAMGLPPVPEQLRGARETYLAAVAARKRGDLSPVVRALFEPELIRFHHRSRAPLGATFTPGGNCDPGRRKLHVTVDGQLQPCERTGTVFTLGQVATGIQAARVNLLSREFHAAVQARCGTCWALRLCGVCYAAQAEHADPGTEWFPVPESVCRRMRAHKEQTLQMMASILAMPPECRQWLDKTVMR